MKHLRKFNEGIEEGTIEDIVRDIKDIFVDLTDEDFILKVLPQRRKSRKIDEEEYTDLKFYNISIDVQKLKRLPNLDGGVGIDNLPRWADDNFDVNDIMEELQRLDDYLKSIGSPWCKFNAKLIDESTQAISFPFLNKAVNKTDKYIVSGVWIYCKVDIK